MTEKKNKSWIMGGVGVGGVDPFFLVKKKT